MERQLLNEMLAQIQPEPLTQAHLKDIAELHFKELSWSFNGQFGKKHIYQLYETLFQSSYFFGYVYYSNGILLGFVTGTTDYADIRSLLIGVYQKKMLAIMRIFLKHPRFFLTALESKLVVPLIYKRFNVKAELLTLLTDTTRSYVSPFVALRLMQILNEHFMTAGIKTYMGQGFRDNPKAVRYYEKLKWRVAARLMMHNVYIYDAS